tara:strand:+ start:1180 stop:1392 length:213 start_codon:yes stop_codon:yes gene_type:complete
LVSAHILLKFNIFGIINRPKMKKGFFKMLSRVNKKILPSYSKKQLDLAKASKFQLAVFGWKLWVTKNALD